MKPLQSQAQSKGALDGVKVIELASWLAGPVAALILGDCGAEIIKVEPPLRGDSMRGYVADPAHPEIENYLFELAGRNKRSITLDLNTERGRQIFEQLIGSADVFITNFQPRVVEKLDVTYQRLRALNPRLIYGWLTGLGSDGPDKDRPGFDVTCFWTRSGLMSYHGEPGETISMQGSMGDMVAAACLATGIMAALNARERHGEGQLVETSLLQAGLWAGAHPLSQVLITGVPWPKVGRRKVVNPLRNNYKTADGRWVMFSMLQSDLFWPRLIEALGDDEPRLRDERFNSHSKRAAHAAEIIALLDNVIGQRTLEEWTPIFEKYEFVWEPVQHLDEVINDPQVAANRYIVPLETPGGKVAPQIRVPFQLSRDHVHPRQKAAELGQHTEEILLELGYTWDDIQSLVKKEVI